MSERGAVSGIGAPVSERAAGPPRDAVSAIGDADA
jgi:hypothetical protein